MTRRIGPETHRKLNTARALTEGKRCWEMVWIEGMSYRAVAATMRMSVTTCWRRANLWHDWTMPVQWGNPVPRRLPPQRGTARCPRGRPYIPGHDGPVEYRPPRHLIPGQRCTKLRRDGQQCQAWCQRGGFVCSVHGGRIPQVQEAARRRVEELERESRELEQRGREDRGWHHHVMKTGAAQRSMFSGADLRRQERTETRNRRTA